MAGGPAGLQAALGLLSRGPELVCVKRGGNGCVLFGAVEQVEHPGFAVEVRDTAAAGDSFDAALIYAYLHGWRLGEMAAFANAMGAAKVRKVGSGSQVPTAVEVQAVLDQFSVGLRIAP
jgi:ribokinase